MITVIKKDRLQRLFLMKRGFTLVEVLLAISIIIIIYIGATTAQISSEVFLKNIRADFEKHLELNNALDHIIKNIRRSRFADGFPQSPDVQTLRLKISDVSGIVRYFQRGDSIFCSLESESVPIARDARISFNVTGSVVNIQIIEDISDAGEADKIPILVISKAYARDK